MAGIIAEGRRLLDGVAGRRRKLPSEGTCSRAMNFDYVDKAVVLAGWRESTVFIRDFLLRWPSSRPRTRPAERLRSAFARRRCRRGAIAWGEQFVDKFANYCLASPWRAATFRRSPARAQWCSRSWRRRPTGTA